MGQADPVVTTAQVPETAARGVAPAPGATPTPPILADPAPAPEASPGRARTFATAALVVLGAVVVAALYGRVAIANFSTGVVGGDIDGYENLWNHWWVQTALLDLHKSPFFTPYLYYPTGLSLRFHALTPVVGVLAIPFNALIGFVATTNLFFLVALALTHLTAFLLIRDLVGDPWAAFAAAGVFTYANEHTLLYYGAGQDNLIHGEWLPLYFFFLFRALDGVPRWTGGLVPARDLRGRRLYAVGAVATLLVTSLTDWEYVLWEVLGTLLYFAFVLGTRRPAAAKRAVFARLAGIGGAYALIAGPALVWPMVQEAAANPWLSVGYESALHSQDLRDLIAPGLGNPGYLVVAVAAFGFVVAWRRGGGPRATVLFWTIAAAVFTVIALGPALVWDGQSTGIPLPYALVQDLPILSIGRDPGRYEVMLRLGLAILAAFGIRGLAAGIVAPQRRKGRD